MSRASKDVKSVISHSRTSLDLLRLQMSTSPTASPKVSSDRQRTQETDMGSLLRTIESQRTALDQRAKGMQALQTDIMALVKLLEEEKRRKEADNAQANKLIAENGRFKFQISEFQRNVNAQNKAKTDLESKVKDLQQVLELKSSLAQGKDLLLSTKTGTAALQNEIIILKGREGDILRILNTQTVQLTEQRKRIDTLNSSNTELSTNNTELRKAIQEKTEECEAQKKLADDTQEKLDQTTSDLFLKMSELSVLKASEVKMNEKFQIWKEEEEKLLSKYKSEAMTAKLLLEKCTSLELLLAEQKNSDGKDGKLLESRVRELQNRLAEQVTLAKKSEDKVKDISQQTKIEKETFNARLKEAEQSVAQLQGALQANSELLEKLTKLEATLDQMSANTENQRETEAALNRNFRQLQLINEQLSSQLAERNALIETMRQEKIQTLQNTSIQLAKEKDAFLRDLKALKIKLKASEATMEEMRVKMQKEKADKAQLSNEVSRLSALKNDAQTSAQTETMRFRAEIAQLEIDLSAAQQHIETLAIENGELKTQLQKQTSENAQLKSLLVCQSQDYSSLVPLHDKLAAEKALLLSCEGDLFRGVQLLETASESLEGNTTCFACLELIKDAVMCLPCGHVFCAKCKDTSRGCSECGSGKPVMSVIRVGLIDMISGKVGYNKQVIQSMRQALEKLHMASFESPPGR